VDLASLFLKGPEEKWFASYILGRRGITWEDFVVDIYLDLETIWKVT